jgi:hypothetical protein
MEKYPDFFCNSSHIWELAENSLPNYCWELVKALNINLRDRFAKSHKRIKAMIGAQQGAPLDGNCVALHCRRGA